jgi:hypothetical protein
MEWRYPRPLPRPCAALFAVAITVLGADAPASGHEADGRPARIHSGSCDEFRGVVYILTGVGAETFADGTPVPTPERVGSESAALVATSETEVPVTLSELMADEAAIVVYESDEAMDRVVACGSVGGLLTEQMPGMAMPGDELAVWLAEEDGSGLSGVALLGAEGRSTVVRLYLGEGLAGHQRAGDGNHHAEATPGA